MVGERIVTTFHLRKGKVDGLRFFYWCDAAASSKFAVRRFGAYKKGFENVPILSPSSGHRGRIYGWLRVDEPGLE